MIGSITKIEPQPFAESAFELTRKGLAVVPCPQGKSPKGAVAGFQRWTAPPSEKYLRQMMDKWGKANIAVVTGQASNVTVVDVDGDKELVAEMLRRFGETPLITSTPSGGSHLWYRFNGERCANLRSKHAFPVDVKGRSGVVLVPPSRNVSTGVPYAFELGSFDVLPRLPKIRVEGLKLLSSNSKSEPTEFRHELRVGQRNMTLFKYALRLARKCSVVEELTFLLHKENDAAPVPLPTSEIADIAQSAWKYEQEGRNWVGRGLRAEITELDLMALSHPRTGPEALWLLCRLKQAHGSKSPSIVFAAAPDAMAHGPLMPLSGPAIRRALKVLGEQGLLFRVHKGGYGPHDPGLFSFNEPRPHHVTAHTDRRG